MVNAREPSDWLREAYCATTAQIAYTAKFDEKFDAEFRTNVASQWVKPLGALVYSRRSVL